MSPQLTKAIDQSRSFISTLNSRQKTASGAILLATFGFFGVLVHFLGYSDLKTLYSGLQPADAQEVSRRLGARNIRYEISKDGTSVSVPAGRIDEVRMQLASEGLPRSGRQGYEMFDKPNWAGSDFAEKVNYQRALEGELERTIQTLNEVEAARVHLVMPHDSLFTDQERNAKASVVLKLRAGRISDDKIDAITYLVSSAVDNLQPKDVTVVDADGQVPLLSGRNRPGAPQALTGYEGSLNEKLLATLTPVVGTGKVKATVSVDYDPGTLEITQELYDPNAVAVLNSQISEERQGPGDDESGQRGIPGTTSNVPGSTAQAGENLSTTAQTDSSEDTVQRTENKTYAVSKTTRHSAEPPGILKKISAAVLVDDAVEVSNVGGKKVETRRKRTPEEMKQIQDIATAAIGIDATRGDRITVQNLSFVALPNEVESRPTWGGRVENIVQDWSPLLKYVLFVALALFLYLSFLKPLTNRVFTTILEPKRSLTADRATAALAGTQTKPEEETPMLNEPIADFGRELADAGSEVKRVVALKRQLVDKIKTEPAAASRLVQKWVRQSEA
jgi:flagellar M-ring protein FliF